MKPIDDVSLKTIATSALDEFRTRKIVAVREVIESKIAELEQKEKDVIQAQRQYVKATEARDKLLVFLEKVRDGNWDVINLSEQQTMEAATERERR